MSLMKMINAAFESEDGAGFTLNIWLQGGAHLRNVAIRPHRPDASCLIGEFQETGNPVWVRLRDIAALEIEW
jgi:hypothetical protein